MEENIKTVFDLLNKINKKEFDSLPNKIEVCTTNFETVGIFEKVSIRAANIDSTTIELQYYKEIETDQELMKYLIDSFAPNVYLELPVIPLFDNKKNKEEKWKPKKGEYYWYVNTNGDIDDYSWNYDDVDNFLYDTKNCFKTKEEAQKHLDNIGTEIELRKLAEELNNGEEINWNNAKQGKNYFYYDYEDDCIYSGKESTEKNAKTIYCLDYEFREKAIEKIGEKRLRNYLKEE